MTSTHVGFRRARTTSWSLVGIGAAGVAAASLLAYADTAEKHATNTGDESTFAMPDAPEATYTMPTTTTSVAPSFSPRIHTWSFGS